MIFLINGNSTVCSDHDHVRVGTHVVHDGRVKNDEDVYKEQEEDIENIIKIWIYLEPVVGLKSLVTFWKAESKQKYLAQSLTSWQHWFSFCYAVQSEMINLQNYIFQALAEQHVLHQPMPWLQRREIWTYSRLWIRVTLWGQAWDKKSLWQILRIQQWRKSSSSVGCGT